MHYSNRLLFFVILIVIITILIDTSIFKMYSFIPKPTDPILDIILFTFLAAISFIAQSIILRYIRIKRTEIGKQSHLNLKILYHLVTIVQYSSFIPLIIAILEMLLSSSYANLILSSVISFNYILTIIVLGLLTIRFFSWFSTNPNHIVMVYGIAIGTLMINTATTFLYVFNILVNQSPYIVHHVGQVFAFGAYRSLLYSIYFDLSITSFVTIWFATVLLLHHYSKKMGRIKYWIIVSIPLVYFLGQFQPLFLSIFSWYRQSDPITFGITYTLFFTTSKVVGGILFGIAFWTMAKNLSHKNIVGSYLILAGYGFMLVIASNQAIALVNYPYPPFGLVTVSFLSLSSYLLYIGIYSCAVSVAQDVKLRQSIRRFATKQSKLLDSIGTAYIGQEIENKVLHITSKNQDKMIEETGIQSSLEEQDIKNYLNEVLTELKKTKK